MTDELTPALTAEEWATPHHDIQCYDSWSDEQSAKTGVGEISAGPEYLKLTSHQHGEIADFSAPTDRHALAALCLHGQPFGFTQEDVQHLLRAANHWGCETGAACCDDAGNDQRMLSIANRIAALLPPPPPPMETP